VNEESNDGLPPGWESVPLNALCQINPPLDRCVVNDAVEVNFVPMRAVESQGAGLVRPEVRPYGKVKKGYTSFLSGDVIMAKITPCMENGKTAVVPPLPRSICFGSTEFHVVRPESGVSARWIAGYLVQHEVRRNAQRAMTGGVGQMRVPAAFLELLRIPIAPTEEQERIADALDELLSDLEAGVAALERVRDKLKLYRAAVLKAAAEGALTAEWRKQHPQTEPAAELLERILAERRRRWEDEQLRKFKDNSREPPKDWRAKYKEPVTPDTTDLPPLPERWCWATVDQVTSEIRNGYSSKPDADSGVPILRISAVRPFAMDLNDVRFLRGAVTDYADSLIAHRDLLFTRYNGTVSLVGVCATVPEIDKPIVHPDKLIRARPLDEVGAPAFLALAANVGASRAYIAKRIRTTAGQAGVSGSDIKGLPIPLASAAEQNAILEAAEDQLSIIDHLESDLGAKLKSAQSLRQAILRDAFSGKLVPQDPNDEPASELLARIAAEREQRAREAATPKKLKSHKPPRAAKRRPKAPRTKATNKKETGHGRIADR
jgi:type I restriction enzyme S subunit